MTARALSPLSILLLAAIGVKLICPRLLLYKQLCPHTEVVFDFSTDSLQEDGRSSVLEEAVGRQLESVHVERSLQEPGTCQEREDHLRP